MCNVRKQNTISRPLESAKSALDDQKHVGAVMTDLSRAFDCLPPKLMITKFHAFDVTERSCELLCSYLRDRYQRVKLGNSRSQWEPVLKGAAQGSLMGPFCYNVLCIHLFFVITNDIQMFNYADDNTIMCQDKNQNNVTVYLQDMANKMTTWFTNNSMKINPGKFNAIMFGKNKCVDFKFNGINVKSMDEVKLLGVNIDKKLNFDSHVYYLCKKTSRQVNALSRLRHIANEKSKNMLYKTYIMSNFNYCSAIWNYCSTKSIIKLEKLNKRALRIVLNDDKCTYHDYLAPHRGRARYCNAHVCLCVCLFVCLCVCLCVCPCFRKISKCNISAISQPIIMKLGIHITYGYTVTDKYFQNFRSKVKVVGRRKVKNVIWPYLGNEWS